MLSAEQHSLNSALNSVTRPIEALNTDLDDNARLIDQTIDPALHSADACCRAPEQIRRLLNQALFERIEVTMIDGDDHRVQAILAVPFRELLGAGFHSRTDTEHGGENEELPAGDGGEFP
ncbi:hypothetical protein [Microbacterium sp.]|uniref:hypothetical protein n=1 Tax=Microbacterium sp. TaxID=51671 RepID=UPI003F99CB98